MGPITVRVKSIREFIISQKIQSVCLIPEIREHELKSKLVIGDCIVAWP